MHSNSNLYLINISWSFRPFVMKIFSGNENVTSIKGNNSATNKRQMTGNNPKLDLVIINA